MEWQKLVTSYIQPDLHFTKRKRTVIIKDGKSESKHLFEDGDDDVLHNMKSKTFAVFHWTNRIRKLQRNRNASNKGTYIFISVVVLLLVYYYCHCESVFVTCGRIHLSQISTSSKELCVIWKAVSLILQLISQKFVIKLLRISKKTRPRW